MKIGIKCDMNCEECFFNWRNAQYNPDCILYEILDHITEKSKNIELFNIK